MEAMNLMPYKPMELPTALNLAVLVLEFEAENSDEKVWVDECRLAANAIRQVAAQPPPTWVTRRATIRATNFNLIAKKT